MANRKIAALMLMLLMAISIIPAAVMGDSESETEKQNSLADKCTSEGGETRYNYDHTERLCIFPDGSVCSLVELSSGECTKGECAAECGAIGTRSEGWYDCNNKLLFWENCEGQTVPSVDNDTETKDKTEEKVDNETQDEMTAVISPHGAEVRLLQLEKAITANILKGEKVVNYILNKTPSANVTAANKILDDMALLLDEVKAANTTGTGEELAQEYVDLKSDAITLTQQFRKAVKDLIPAGDRDELMRRLNSIKHPQLDKLDNAISEATHLYNADQVKAIFTSLGITDEALIKAVEDGTATKEQIKTAIKAALADMTPEQKKEALLKLREALSKKAVSHRAAIANALANRFERQSQRWEERSQTFLNKSLEAEAHNQTVKSLVMEEVSERAQEMSDDFEEKAGELRDMIQERLKERERNGNATKDSEGNESDLGED